MFALNVEMKIFQNKICRLKKLHLSLQHQF